jgi:hypothetical protein
MAGRYKGHVFTINYTKDRYLMLTLDKFGVELLFEMSNYINDYLHKEPLACYDFLNTNFYWPMLEWNMKYEEERTTALANNELCWTHNNLIIYDKEKNKYRHKDKKIYGLYPGVYTDKVNEINNYNEQQMFFMFQLANNRFLRTLLDDEELIKQELDISEELYGFQYIINRTREYGVNITEPKLGRRIRMNNSIEKWYEYWNNYFYRKLDYIERCNFSRKLSNGEDVSIYRPEGDWQKQLNRDKIRLN